jgi:hypothetical protein
VNGLFRQSRNGEFGRGFCACGAISPCFHRQRPQTAQGLFEGGVSLIVRPLYFQNLLLGFRQRRKVLVAHPTESRRRPRVCFALPGAASFQDPLFRVSDHTPEFTSFPSIGLCRVEPWVLLGELQSCHFLVV